MVLMLHQTQENFQPGYVFGVGKQKKNIVIGYQRRHGREPTGGTLKESR